MNIRSVSTTSVLVFGYLFSSGTASVEAATARRDTKSSQAYSDNVAIIFLPGIFGSKLTCTAAGKYKDAVIWGDGNYGGNGLSLDDCPTAKPELLDRAEINDMSNYWKRLLGRVAGAISDLNVYSKFKESLKFSTDAHVVSFAYDWRRSNTASAAEFQNFLCDEFSSAKFKKYIFVSHSMGGLVLDSWIKAFFATSQACKNGPMPIERAQVSYFIFGGTPFLGAPEVVNSMFSGDNSMTKDKYFRILFGDTLIEDAITFDSVYELIPFTSIMKSDCNVYQDTPIIEKQSVSGDRSIMNLSMVGTWKELSIPARVPAAIKKDEYGYIGNKVESASNVVCQRLSADISDDVRAKYRYIVGKLRSNNTFENTTIVSGWAELNDSKPEFHVGLGQGDGTVPEWSAMSGIGTSEMNQFSVNTHDHIYDDVSIMNYLERSVAATAKAIGLRQKLDASDAIDRNEFNNYVKTASSDSVLLDNDSYAELAQSLSKVAKRSGIQAIEIYRYTREAALSDSERALSFTVAGFSGGNLNEKSQAFSWINGAELSFKMNNPSLAWFLAQKGLADLSLEAVSDENLKARLNSISGKSKLYLGDYGGFADLDSAVNAGWAKAGQNKAKLSERIGVDLFLDAASVPAMSPPT